MLHVDFEKAIKYPFSDHDWVKKLLIAGLICLIPLIGMIVVLGWSLRIMKNVMNGDVDLLPSVEFSEDFVLGIKSFVIVLPFIVINAILGTISSALLPRDGTSNTALIMLLLGFAVNILSVAISVCFSAALPVMYGSFLKSGVLSDAFDSEEIIKKVFNSKNFISLLLYGFLASFILNVWSFLGTMLCLVGLLVTVPAGFATMGNIYGQTFKAIEDQSIGMSPKNYVE